MNLLPLIILAVCFIAGMPIAFSLVLCVVPYFLADPHIASSVIVQRLIANTDSTSLMAVPFFIIAGSIMNHSGISRRLMNFADTLVGHFTGGLGHVNVVLSTLMGGISGSGAADAAMESKLLVPEMERYGYSRAYSGAITAASACITPIIPPGVGLVVFAIVCETSIGKLFAAGYLPGLLMCLGMMLLNAFISKRRGYVPSRAKRASIKEILKSLKEAVWALFLPFGLILGLRFGVFTATEGGALMALYSLLVGKFVYKELKLRDLPRIMRDAVFSIGAVMLVLCAASVFSYYLSWERIPQAITTWLISFSSSKIVFLLMVNILMLVLGMFLDAMASMIIVAPLLAPVATALGISLVQFGVVMVLNCAIGAITPPFGTYIFLVAGTIREKTNRLVRELWPFIIVCILVLLVATYWPDFSLIIPRLLFGNV